TCCTPATSAEETAGAPLHPARQNADDRLPYMCPGDPAPPNPPAAEPALARGAALGRFVVLGLVGRGAMGEVYAAYDPDLDRKVAIKLVRADRSGDTVESRARLMREAQ